LNADRFSKLTYLKALRGHEITNGAYRVLVAIFNYTDEAGENAHPGEQRLAADTGLSSRSVRDYLKWLTEKKYLIKGPRGHGNGGQKPGMATVYALGMPDLPAEARPLDEEVTGEIPQATGEIPLTNRQRPADQPAKSRPLSDPVSDPLSSDPSPSNPPELECYTMREWDEIVKAGGEEAYKATKAGQSEPVSRSSRPANVSDYRVIRIPIEHDSPDEYLQACSECYYRKRPCGKVRERELVSVAAEPDWDSLDDDGPGW
jgi:hypothetical protein